METFTGLKELVENPHYHAQRKKQLAALSESELDAPIVEIIHSINQLLFCFTLQSCYGHFLYGSQRDLNNLEALPDTGDIGSVEYRIAYIALCVEQSDFGKMLLKVLQKITDIDPDNIQFGCAEWFWKRHFNSYVLQVEPDRLMYKDKTVLDYKEALKVEKTRNEFFVALKDMLHYNFL